MSRWADPTAGSLDRCTVQLANGSFCDAATRYDMPFPICPRHAWQVYRRIREHEASVFGSEMARERALTCNAEEAMSTENRKAEYDARALVYYVRIADYIKIGVTTNMRDRLGQLRVDPDALIATEPGGRDLEKRRHEQFAADRIGRRENFKPSRRLLAHIRTVLEDNGAPCANGHAKAP